MLARVEALTGAGDKLSQCWICGDTAGVTLLFKQVKETWKEDKDQRAVWLSENARGEKNIDMLTSRNKQVL